MLRFDILMSLDHKDGAPILGTEHISIRRQLPDAAFEHIEAWHEEEQYLMSAEKFGKDGAKIIAGMENTLIPAFWLRFTHQDSRLKSFAAELFGLVELFRDKELVPLNGHLSCLLQDDQLSQETRDKLDSIFNRFGFAVPILEEDNNNKRRSKM